MTEPAVVFDLGMVLCPPQGLFSGLAELLGTTAEAVEQGFWGPHRHRYDEGCSDLEYWQAACPLIPGAQEVDLEQLLPSLIQVDVASWSTPRPAARALLQRLRQAGVTTAILSNAPTCFAQTAPDFDWYPLIGTWFFSGPMGIAKPAPQIYQRVEDGLGRTGEQLWFIDDKQVNIDAAADRGWHTHLWVDDADTEAWLMGEAISAAASPGSR